MTTRNQRLRSTITIGSVLEASVKRNVGFLKTGLKEVGNSIKEVERRQRDLDRQRKVLRRQGQSVAELDREYEKLERTLIDLRRQQERWNRAAAASRRVGATFSSMASDMARNARRIAVGATLAGGAIFGLASSTAQLGDDVAKTADKLAIGVEELQELRYAAERSGISTGEFDKSLEKMIKNIGLALEGTGAQKDALDLLGLSAANLAEMLPEDALAMIADRMQGIETQAQKAAIANDIFGRSGIGLLNMLRGGSKGLQELREDARKTGFVLSEEAARDAEVFQDTLLDTQLTLKGLKNTVGAELLPVVTQAMRRIGDALVGNREDVKRWAEGFADGVERAMPVLGEIALGLGRVGTVIWNVAESTATMVGGWENFGVVIGAVLASRTIVRVGKFAAAVFSLGKAMVGLAAASPLVVGGIRAIGTALLLNPIGAAVAVVATAVYGIYRNWEKIGPWFQSLWGGVRKSFRGFGDFVGGVFAGDIDRAIGGVKTSFEGLSETIDTAVSGIGSVLKMQYENGIKPLLDAIGLTGPIEAAWASLRLAVGAQIAGIGNVFNAVWGGSIEPVIEGLKATSGIGAAWEAVRSALDPVLSWIRAQFSGVGKVFKAVWTGQIQPVIEGLKATSGIGAAWEAVRSALDPVLSWMKSTFQTVMQYIQPVIDALKWVHERGVSVTSRIGETFGISRPRQQVQERASGGSYRPGWLLTGERGPELRYENRGGFIANNRQLRQLAGYASRVGSALSRIQASGAASVPAPAMVSTTSQRVADSGSSGSGTVVQHITNHISAAGASAEELFRLMERKQRQAAGSVLHDRVPYTGPFGR